MSTPTAGASPLQVDGLEPGQRDDRRLVTVPSSRGQLSVVMPARIPWSRLGPHFQADWGRADPANPQPEHLEVLGQSGCGKTYFIGTVMGERAVQRRTAAVCVATKQADETLLKLGWPVVDTLADVRRNRQCIFWPRTSLVGTARKKFLEKNVRGLLDMLWVPNANVMVQFDETGFIEKLSAEVREAVQMYWREGRSHGITVIAGKQRPQGSLREMHSETTWTAAFAPKDEADLERFGELFGPKRAWMEVFRNLDRSRREFLIRNSTTGITYISWVDVPLVPRPRHPDGAGRTIWTAGRRAQQDR